MIVLIVFSYYSCSKQSKGKLPITSEEIAIANYLETFRGVSPKLNVSFHTMNITDISISDAVIFNKEKDFESYQNLISNKEIVTIENIPEKFRNRDPKEIIAKRVNCKFTFSKDPNSLIEQNFILDKTGQKCIYSDDNRMVTGIK